MIGGIVSKLEEREFIKVEVNVDNIYIYYQVIQNNAYIIALLSMHEGTEFTKAQYDHIYKQIKQNFIKQEYEKVDMLTLVLSKRPEFVKDVCGSNIWILDEENHRLLLYEESYQDFLSIRKEIEQLCLIHLEDTQNLYHKGNMRSRIGVMNSVIIVVTICIFLIIDLGNFREMTFEMGALFWPSITYDKEYYRLITAMFLHGDIHHLVNNMLILFVIGTTVEKLIGAWKYGIIYFGTGIVGGLVSMNYNMEKDMFVRSIGASGAVFGIVGALAYIVAINKGRIKDISAKQMWVFVLLSLYSGLTSQGIDNAAHIGGLVAGIVIAAILYRKPRNKGELYED